MHDRSHIPHHLPHGLPHGPSAHLADPDELPRFRWPRRADRGAGTPVATDTAARGPRRRLALAVMALGVLGGASLVALPPLAPAGAQEQPAPGEGQEGVVGPSLDQALADATLAYAEALARSEAAHAAIGALEAEAAAIAVDLAELGGRQQDLARQLADAEVRASDAVLAAYMGTTPTDLSGALLDAESAGDLAFVTVLLTDHVSDRHDALAQLEALRAAVDDRTAEVAGRDAANRLALDTARAELAAADIAQREAERILTVLHSRLAQQVTLTTGGAFVAAGSDGSPLPSESGNADGPGWELLRQCESSGNYAAVSASGRYRGAYQFDIITWQSVGGMGDPVLNTTAEQDLRAQILYDRRGSKPWPVCGRYLDMTAEQLAAILGGHPLPGTPVVPTVAPSPSSSTSTTVDGSSTSTTAGEAPTSTTAGEAPAP